MKINVTDVKNLKNDFKNNVSLIDYLATVFEYLDGLGVNILNYESKQIGDLDALVQIRICEKHFVVSILGINLLDQPRLSFKGGIHDEEIYIHFDEFKTLDLLNEYFELHLHEYIEKLQMSFSELKDLNFKTINQSKKDI